MSNNVRVLESVFRPEEELRDEIRDLIRKYSGKISYAQLLGVLDMLKFECLQAGYIGVDDE